MGFIGSDADGPAFVQNFNPFGGLAQVCEDG
jgi:hypothetical protein